MRIDKLSPTRALQGAPASFRLLILGVAMAISACCGAGPAAADQAPNQGAVSKTHAKQTYGKAMWGPPSIDGVSQFPVYRDLGVGIYQTAVAWSDIAPTEPIDPKNPNDPAYLWPSDMTDTVDEAKRYGMKVALMVIGAPPWANGGQVDRAWAPKDPEDYADFMTAIASKYPGVHMWMIWGEPNRSPNFKPLSPSRRGKLNKAQARAPRIYGKMLEAAYRALKKLDRKNLVIGGNTFTAAGRDSISTYQWIKYMRLPNGRMPRMDFYGHNPFSFRIPRVGARQSPKGRVDMSDLGRLTKRLDRFYPHKRLKLFVSEFGIPGGEVDAELGFGLTFTEQKKWIKASFKVKRKLKRIYTLGWVHPFDRPDVGITTGLLEADGTPKPGYFAYRRG